MPSNGKCTGHAKATDAEIVAFQRAAFRHKTGKGLVVELDDDCALPGRHEGDCAAHMGCLGGYPASAWLRWGGGGRRVDWLADCPADGCALFLGHPGDCDPCGVPAGDRRWHLDLSQAAGVCTRCHDTPRTGHTCPACGATGAEAS